MDLGTGLQFSSERNHTADILQPQFQFKEQSNAFKERAEFHIR